MPDLSFICKRCGYTTMHKHALVKHLKKKKVCEVVIEDISVDELLKDVQPSVKPKTFRCVDRDKMFSHSSGLSRHNKTCLNKNNNELIQNLKEKVEFFEKRLRSLQNQPTSCENKTTNVTGDNNHVTINNGNTYVVVLNNFGSEDVSYVVQDKKFLEGCLKTLHKGIPNVVEKIYYDETKSKNKTVVLKSSKQ